MSGNPIMIVAKFTARAGKSQELQQVLRRGVEPSRSEAGCLHYDLYRSLDDEHVFLFHETWQDQAAIDAHGQQPHFITLMAEAEQLWQQPPEIILK